MKVIFLFIALVSSVSFTTTENSTVYICNSTTSSKYHYKKECRGLNACKARVKAVEILYARKSGRTLCGWED